MLFRGGGFAFRVGTLSDTPILPIASYGNIFAAKWSNNSRFEAVVSKWPVPGQKGWLLTVTLWFWLFRQMRFFVIDHTSNKTPAKHRNIFRYEKCNASARVRTYDLVPDRQTHYQLCYGD